MSTQGVSVTLPAFPVYLLTHIAEPRPVAPVRWFVYRKEQRPGNRVHFIGSYESRAQARARAVALTEQQERVVPRWMRAERNHYHIGPAPLGTCPLDFFLRLHPVDVTCEVF